MIPVKAYATISANSPLAPFSVERRDVDNHDVLVAIHYCGICHSDIHQARNEWGGSIFPMVPGHEITGIVEQVGKQVSRFKVGDRVGIGCFVDSCRRCDNCKEDLEQYCDEGMTGTYNSIARDGSSITYGGYSTKIVADENYVLSIPDNLPLDATAPLLCAGITLYSPLKHWKTGPGKNVAIIGMGGLGHMGVKLAHAMGAKVTVISQSLKKMADGKRLGADEFYAASERSTFDNLAKSFNLIICTVSAQIDWNLYLNLLKRDGTMVLVGLPEQGVNLNAYSLISDRRSLSGSLIGGIKQTQEMLDFCGKHAITADIELIPIQEINIAYERILKSDVRYRFVIDIATLI